MVSRLERQLYYQYSDAIPCGFPQGFLVQINDSLLSSNFQVTFDEVISFTKVCIYRYMQARRRLAWARVAAWGALSPPAALDINKTNKYNPMSVSLFIRVRNNICPWCARSPIEFYSPRRPFDLFSPADLFSPRQAAHLVPSFITC